METLESSRVCRLCGKHSGISINIFDKNENHVRKINAVLPIMVHEMDLLPKHMCHRCSYKLEEFHKFYIDCLKTDADLKSQLSWMRKEDSKERIGVPMVHIENLKIKEEPPEYDVYELEPIVENVNYINSMSSVTFPVNGVQTNSLDGMTYATYARCRCYREKEQGGNKLNRPLTRNHRVTSALNPQVGGALKNFERTASEVPATISSSSRTLVDGHQLRAACRNLLEDFDSRAANSAATEPNYSLKENSLEANVKNVMDESVSVTRNLRPRNVSVSYVSKKRCHPSPRAKKTVTKVARTELHVIPRIKVEKVEDVEGRSLRPRNTTVNYFHGRKRTPKIVDAAQQSNAYDVKRFKVSGSSQQEEKAVECRSGRISIKQEPSFDDLPETSSRSLDMSQACSGRILTPRKLSNISLKNSPPGYEKGNGSKTEDMFSPLKTFGRVEKKRTSRLAIRRLDAGCHSPKFLRSQDLHLRNGKVMFDGVARRSAKKLRRDLKVVGRTVTKKQVESGGNALLNVVRGATGAKRIAAMKMIDNYIKHYCEKCSVSFPNNELFKLHACYV